MVRDLRKSHREDKIYMNAQKWVRPGNYCQFRESELSWKRQHLIRT